jgi:hypothetical protein
MTDHPPRLALHDTQVDCPMCDCHFSFRRSQNPAIDSCGFERYTLMCPGCHGLFSGLIDPYDDAFLAEWMTSA